jgi:hypothetical protein
MMRFMAGANPFAHKALNRRMNSPDHQAQLPFPGNIVFERENADDCRESTNFRAFL